MRKIIRSKKLVMLVMSLSILSFSQCLVSAEDVAVAEKAEEVQAVQTKEAVEVKPEIEVVDDSAQLRDSGEYKLGVNFKDGSDSNKLVALYILSMRLTKLVTGKDNYGWWVQFLDNKVEPKALPYFESGLFSGDSDVLDVRYKFCVENGGIAYNYSQEDVDRLKKAREEAKKENEDTYRRDPVVDNVATIWLKDGIAKKINNFIKDANIRNKLAEPITEEELREAKIRSVGKISRDIAWEERYINKNAKRSPEEVRSEIEMQELCCAKNNIKNAEEAKKSKRLATFEGFKASVNKDREKLEKYAKAEGSWYSTTEEGKNSFNTRMKEYNDILGNDETAKTKYNEEIKKLDERIAKAKGILEDKTKLNQQVEERVSEDNKWQKSASSRVEYGRKDIAAIEALSLDDVNNSYKSANLANFNDALLKPDEKDAERRARRNAATPYIDKKLQFLSQAKDAPRVRFKPVFPAGTSNTTKLIANIALLNRLENKDEDVFGRTVWRYCSEPLEDGVVYKFGESYVRPYGGSNSLFENFLAGKDDYIGFEVIAKDNKTLEDFKVKFSEMVKEVSKQITAEDIHNVYINLLSSLSGNFRWKLEDSKDITREDVEADCDIKNGKWREGCSSVLKRLAGKCSEGLREAFQLFEDESFRNAYVENVIKVNKSDTIRENVSRFYDGGLADDCLRDIEKRRNLLSILFSEIEGFNVDGLNSLQPGDDLDSKCREVFAKGVCCVDHAGWQLKKETLAEVQAVFAAWAEKPAVSCEQKANKGSFDYLRKYSSNGEFASWNLMHDVVFAMSLKGRDGCGKVREDLVNIKQHFDNLSVKENVEKLTPEQRHSELVSIAVLANGDTQEAVKDWEKRSLDPELEIGLVCSKSETISKYVEVLINALDGKLG